MKKLLICLFLTAFCCVNIYTEANGEKTPPPLPPGKPGPGLGQDPPSVAPFSSANNTAPQITYTKGYIRVYTAAYQNVIVRVQDINGVILYENTMTQNTLVIDARNWKSGYTLVILNK